GDIQTLLAQLQATAESTDRDISSMQIEKWKTDRNSKGQAQSNAESLRRNLTSALPGMISDVRARPDDLTASFKLYRNLGALYDVLSSLAESAGAFGPKNDFQALAADVSRLDDSRRVLGDRVATLASIKEGELTRLRAQLRSSPPAAQQSTSKKVIVDDNEPKKTTTKKKTTKKPSPATGASTTGTAKTTTPPSGTQQ
ncbi:MAG: hypothetical protein JO187_02960, partial [Acidobacteria bacterium]|nr:hypothetical protein [Acidobacteriota bacterium]